MKIWIDDVRPAPEGYVWCKSVNQAKDKIINQEKLFNNSLYSVKYHMLHNNYQFVEEYLKEAENDKINLIDIDHDAGDYVSDGGDYIKLLDWLEETGRNYPIHIHSMNPVGVENMRRIIKRNGWKEV